MAWRSPHEGYRRPRDGRQDGGRGSWHSNGRDRGESGAEMDDGKHFPVRHPKVYLGNTRTLKTPEVVGYFSVDSEKNIHFDDSMMSVIDRKYFPDGDSMKVDLDLNKGWHRVNGYTGSTAETFKQFLQWIIKNQQKLTAKDSSDKLLADIVCTKGVLKSIMEAPYIHTSNCEMVILAQYFKGSVYMTYQYEDYEGQKEKEKASLLEIYGHKFEQYMTRGDPDEMLECNCQFRCMLKLHLNELVLLYPSPTDGVDQTCHRRKFKDMSSFVTLKAKMGSEDSFKKWNFRKYTLNSWWIGSQLSGVPRLLMGLRNEEGMVHTLKMMETANFPSDAEGEWEPSVCINILGKFLNFMKEKVMAEPHTVHCFERSASASKYIRHFHSNVTNILPKWYRQQLFASEDNSD